MGILRADRVSGLGGANAINGSVKFTGDGGSSTSSGVSLNIADATDKSDLNFAGNDFTFEAWVYPFDNVQWNCVYSQSWGLQIYTDTVNGYVKIYVASSDTSSYAISGATSAGGTINADAWNHVAFSRSGNSWTIFTNGTAATSSTSSQSLVSSDADYTIGIFNSVKAGNDAGSYFGFKGYISNLRIRTGAHYTASFTPPAERLEKTSDTVLLCCQSPGDATKEETGKILTPTTKNTNDKPPAASHFAPDKGEDHGTTFADNTKFDTLSYMVPPGGTTTQRGRGRAVLGGGYGPTYQGGIQYMEMSSGGKAINFGELYTGRYCGGSSSDTRGLFLGGEGSGGTNYNIIDYVTIATTSNSVDFGDLTTVRRQIAGLASPTRGVFGAGYTAPVNSDVIDYATIATLGNATDFGNILSAGRGLMGASSPTRGVWGGGAPGPTSTNVIQYVTIASTGNATDFGDLTVDRRQIGSGAVADTTRAVFIAGNTNASPSNTMRNTMDYVTIATTGNATDFGDATASKTGGSSISNSIIGIYGGGYTPSYIDNVDSITIQTTGNAVSHGNLTQVTSGSGNCSDSHGGIS